MFRVVLFPLLWQCLDARRHEHVTSRYDNSHSLNCTGWHYKIIKYLAIQYNNNIIHLCDISHNNMYVLWDINLTIYTVFLCKDCHKHHIQVYLFPSTVGNRSCKVTFQASLLPLNEHSYSGLSPLLQPSPTTHKPAYLVVVINRLRGRSQISDACQLISQSQTYC